VLDQPTEATYREWLERVAEAVEPVLGSGRAPEYIPALSDGDPRRFGMAIATIDGAVHGIGDWRERFSIQSISKLFALALVIARGGRRLWERVGREPSADPFDSLAQVERDEGMPPNPFFNAGALVVCDELLTLTGDACGTVEAFLRAEAGDAGIATDPRVAASEAAHGARNAALANLLASYGNLHNDVPAVLDHYVRQCAIAMSCEELVRAASFLARHGARLDGTPLLSRSDAKRVNAVLLMCGVYGIAGEFAYRVGLPAKSGVGGGILAVIPNRCTLCAWSPGLDESGSSIASIAALDAFTTMTGWSVF
jgi:glutaminase